MDTSVPAPADSLKGDYERLMSLRDPYLVRARECAKLTIPTLVPPVGAGNSTIYPTPYQSLGARGVNNLSAKLLLTLFPPNSPFFQLVIDDFTLEKLTGQKGLRAMIEEALTSMERAVMTDLETSNIRVAAFEALKLLLVSGNVLLFLQPEGGMKVYRLDRYVVKRDPSGNVLRIITKECLSELEVPEDIRAQVMTNAKETRKSGEDTIELYTSVTRTLTGWDIKQECSGVPVESASGSYPKDKSPWMALRFIAMDGEDYGRGYVEEYLGDIKSLEGLTGAIVKASAAAAKVIFLVNPNATTKVSALSKSESGDFREGRKDDITVLQMDKFADFKVALATIDKLEQRLSYAFLLNTSIQRNGERVTAEEIRYMASELESALGGIYSTLSQEFQQPVVRYNMARMERQGKIPTLPKGVVRPQITTGIEALGRGNDLTKLAGLLQDLQPLGPEVISQYLNVGDYIQRSANGRGIDSKGLVRTPEEVAQREQQASMQAMMAQLGPNAINQMGTLAKTSMEQGSAPPTVQ